MNINNKQNQEGNADPESRLKKLKAMHDEGLITDEQFSQKREEILKEL